MTELIQTGRSKLWAVAALSAVCLAAAFLPAQEDPAPEQFISLDSKAVSKLRLSSGAPDYPPIAKVNFIHGEVRIRIFVSRQGRVIRMHAVQGHPFLVVAAMEAIREWTYKPYRIGKEVREFSTLVSVHFRLQPRVLTDLPPTAERDLEARVEPPKVVEQPADPPSDSRVRLRVLVGSNGKALDSQCISGSRSEAHQAEQELMQWKFVPARWGSLPVPWYLDVEVPIHHSPA